MEEVNTPPPIPYVFNPRPPRIYQFSKTRKTDDMVIFMAKNDKIPYTCIHDPFIDINTEELSHYSNEHIQEWIRASQIILFNQFQHSMLLWTELTKNIKSQIVDIKYARKLNNHVNSRREMDLTAISIDTEKIQKLPDDIIHLIWSFVDDEVRNKYFLGKYLIDDYFTVLLQRLNLKTLKTLYKKTAFCYHGLCMEKIIPPERYDNPPVNRKNKQDFIYGIHFVLKEYLKMYFDPFVITTTKPNGQLISKINSVRNDETNSYFGMVYPLAFYEKKMLRLWKHLAIAFSHFLSEDFYEKIYKPQSHFLQTLQIINSMTPSSPEIPEELNSPNHSIDFILF
jgi:hypothetical protein